MTEQMSIKSHQEKSEIPEGPKPSFIFQVRLDLDKDGVLGNFVCTHVWPLPMCEPNN